ncbi:MAG: hypothetical protein QQN63_02515 [Nitrosopumilus sp.]
MIDAEKDSVEEDGASSSEDTSAPNTSETEAVEVLGEAGSELSRVDEEPSGESGAFDRLFKGVSSDDRRALMDRMLSEMDDEDKGKLSIFKDSRDRNVADAEVRKEKENRIARGRQRNTLVDRSTRAKDSIRKHVTTVMEAVDKGRTEDNTLDETLIERQMEEYAVAEAGLRNEDFIQGLSSSIVGLIHEHGPDITTQELQAMAVASDGTFKSLFRNYMLEFGNRRFHEGLEEGNENSKLKDASWRASEEAALRAEAFRSGNGDYEEFDEPESIDSSPASQALEKAGMEGTGEDNRSSHEKITAGLKKSRKRKSRRS